MNNNNVNTLDQQQSDFHEQVSFFLFSFTISVNSLNSVRSLYTVESNICMENEL